MRTVFIVALNIYLSYARNTALVRRELEPVSPSSAAPDTDALIRDQRWMLESSRWPHQNEWGKGVPPNPSGIKAWKQISGYAGDLDFPDAYDTHFKPCDFLTEYGTPARCGLEIATWDLVNEYVEPGATVLELGARYGTTTCVASRKVKHSGRVITVEPDARVWNALEKNLDSHGCKAFLQKGSIGFHSSKGRFVNVSVEDPAQRSFMSHTALDYSHVLDFSSQAVYSVLDIQSEHSLSIDTIVADCELCFVNLFHSLKDGVGGTFLKQIKLIILEVDGANGNKDLIRMYEDMKEHFERVGLKRVKVHLDNSWGWSGEHWVFQRLA